MKRDQGGRFSKDSTTSDYDTQRTLSEFDFYTNDDIEKFTVIYYSKQAQDRLHMILTPVVDWYKEVEEQEQADFRKMLTDYIRLYAFLAHIIPFMYIEKTLVLDGHYSAESD